MTTTLPDIDTWRGRAACRGRNPDLFHPDTLDALRHAQAICATCPVQTDCLAHARRQRLTDGVWGGEWFGGKLRNGRLVPRFDRPGRTHGTDSGLQPAPPPRRAPMPGVQSRSHRPQQPAEAARVMTSAPEHPHPVHRPSTLEPLDLWNGTEGEA